MRERGTKTHGSQLFQVAVYRRRPAHELGTRVEVSPIVLEPMHADLETPRPKLIDQVAVKAVSLGYEVER